MANSRQLAERLIRYLNFVAYKAGLVNAQIRFKVHDWHFGRPDFNLKEWVVRNTACPCPNLKELVADRLNRLVRLKHGFGEVTVSFKNLKFAAIVVASNYRPDEPDELGDQFDPSS